MKLQRSESLEIGILLAISGGLMDAYSYLFRGEVFANAQTGNILLFSVNLAQGNWAIALQYACPVTAFSCGIALAAILRHICPSKKTLHWRQYCVLFEALVLFGVAWIPQTSNLLANSLISLACGAQVESFRKIADASVATTMCIGNLRLAIHDAIAYGFTGVLKEKVSAQVSAAMIVSFAIGAVLGNSLIAKIGTYAILGSTTILLCCFVSMFMSPDIKDDVGKEEPVESI